MSAICRSWSYGGYAAGALDGAWLRLSKDELGLAEEDKADCVCGMGRPSGPAPSLYTARVRSAMATGSILVVCTRLRTGMTRLVMRAVFVLTWAG